MRSIDQIHFLYISKEYQKVYTKYFFHTLRYESKLPNNYARVR